jgi:hypothetical protein
VFVVLKVGSNDILGIFIPSSDPFDYLRYHFKCNLQSIVGRLFYILDLRTMNPDNNVPPLLAISNERSTALATISTHLVFNDPSISASPPHICLNTPKMIFVGLALISFL